jgi:hypothetical protein
MPQFKTKLFVNARFDVIWQKLLDKIAHPEKYLQGIRHVQILENEDDHVLRLITFDDDKLQELKELIVADKQTGIILYRLVDHPHFQGQFHLTFLFLNKFENLGETINICRTTNQVYQSELEYEINWKRKADSIEESNEEKEIAERALQLALNEMKRVSEEAESVYS